MLAIKRLGTDPHSLEQTLPSSFPQPKKENKKKGRYAKTHRKGGKNPIFGQFFLLGILLIDVRLQALEAPHSIFLHR